MIWRRRVRTKFWLAVLLTAVVVEKSAQAADLSLPSSSFQLELHGFVSQGYLLSSGNNYLAETTERGSLEFSEVGLNFTAQLTDDLRAGVQLFAHDLGP